MLNMLQESQACREKRPQKIKEAARDVSLNAQHARVHSYQLEEELKKKRLWEFLQQNRTTKPKFSRREVDRMD